MNQEYHFGPDFAKTIAQETMRDKLRSRLIVHAPPMPKDFDRKGRKVLRILEDANGRKREANVQEWETPAQHAARWAVEYANAVLAALGEQ